MTSGESLSAFEGMCGSSAWRTSLSKRLSFALNGTMAAPSVPPLSKSSRVARSRPPLVFSPPWQPRQLFTSTGRMCWVKVTRPRVMRSAWSAGSGAAAKEVVTRRRGPSDWSADAHVRSRDTLEADLLRTWACALLCGVLIRA